MSRWKCQISVRRPNLTLALATDIISKWLIMKTSLKNFDSVLKRILNFFLPFCYLKIIPFKMNKWIIQLSKYLLNLFCLCFYILLCFWLFVSVLIQTIIEMKTDLCAVKLRINRKFALCCKSWRWEPNYTTNDKPWRRSEVQQKP